MMMDQQANKAKKKKKKRCKLKQREHYICCTSPRRASQLISTQYGVHDTVPIETWMDGWMAALFLSPTWPCVMLMHATTSQLAKSTFLLASCIYKHTTRQVYMYICLYMPFMHACSLITRRRHDRPQNKKTTFRRARECCQQCVDAYINVTIMIHTKKEINEIPVYMHACCNTGSSSSPATLQLLALICMLLERCPIPPPSL